MGWGLMVGHGAMHTLLRPGPTPVLLSWMLCFLPGNNVIKVRGRGRGGVVERCTSEAKWCNIKIS